MRHDFLVRGIEIHSLYAWDFEWLLMTMNFMERMEMNTLVLHRNDFIELLVYPGKYFGCKKEKYDNIFERYSEIFRKVYKYTPTRRSGLYQRRAFLKRVLREAKRRGIDVYVENKELYFPDIILEFYPHLVKDGHICATDPFWIEYTKVKYTEFFEEFPEISGIITAPATGESRVSIKSNRCVCERCKNEKPQDWFDKVLRAMYEPLHKAGKTLVVRDFVFDPQAHNEIASVMEALPEDVIISCKNTPHDYYPTFPENERIGQVGNHRQWIEFDSMGQYFGWGIGIADLTEDYRWRMSSARKKGAEGVIFRTDWESLDGHTAFRTPNKLNLYAASLLSTNLNTNSHDIYQKYLEDEGWFKDHISAQQKERATQWFASLMSKTWNVTSKTPFIDGCVFSDSSLMPISLEHAFWLSEEKNSLRDWDHTKWESLYPKKENLEKAFREKEQALEEIQSLYSQALEGFDFIKEEKIQWLQDRFYVNKKYVSLYGDVTKAIMLTRYVLETKEERNTQYFKMKKEQLRTALIRLKELEEELTIFHETTEYAPHTIYALLDPDRVNCLYKDLNNRLMEE